MTQPTENNEGTIYEESRNGYQCVSTRLTTAALFNVPIWIDEKFINEEGLHTLRSVRRFLRLLESKIRFDTGKDTLVIDFRSRNGGVLCRVEGRDMEQPNTETANHIVVFLIE